MIEDYRPADLGSFRAEVYDLRGAAEPIFDPWEDYTVPDFPVEILPLTLARFIQSEAEIIGCDPNGIAMACLAAIGAALDHRFAIKVMRNGQWWASPRLWVLLSGDPSRKKTPIINTALRELEAYQAEDYESWRALVDAHKAAGLPEEEGPKRPARYVIGDITVEKLGELLSQQDRGLLVKRDELSGWIGSMERYGGRGGGASDRAFWLQAYDGGPYHVDRIKGDRFIKNLSVSLIGGIQPARLAEMHDLTTDGLLQRFVPVVLKPSRFPIDAPDTGAVNDYGRLLRTLAETEKARLIMEDDALAAFEGLRRHIFDLEQVSGGLAQGFQAFAGKLSSTAASLALILHMAEFPQDGRERRVDNHTVTAVITIIKDFVLPHAFEFYRSAESTTEGDRLKRLASWILTSGKDRIVASDLATNVSGFRGLGLGEVAQRLSPLIATGWLAPEGSDPVARAWRVLPGVRAQMADRRKVEEARKSAMAQIMKSPRKAVSA